MSRKSVLLVESDVALRQETARLLRTDDVAVSQADNCEAAFQELMTHRFDVIAINVTVAVLPGSASFLQVVRDQLQPCIFVSPAGELWLSTTEPEQAVLRGTFGVGEFATCIADAIRKVLLTAHLASIPPISPAIRPTRH